MCNRIKLKKVFICICSALLMFAGTSNGICEENITPMDLINNPYIYDYEELIQNYTDTSDKPTESAPIIEMRAPANPELTSETITDETTKASATPEIKERRQYSRYDIKALKYPVLLKSTNPNAKQLVNISRGGAAIIHENNISPGEIIPIHIIYKDIEINTSLQIISTTENIAGGQFVNMDKTIQSQLLYLSIVLDSDNDMLITRFRKDS